MADQASSGAAQRPSEDAVIERFQSCNSTSSADQLTNSGSVSADDAGKPVTVDLSEAAQATDGGDDATSSDRDVASPLPEGTVTLAAPVVTISRASIDVSDNAEYDRAGLRLSVSFANPSPARRSTATRDKRRRV